MGGQVNSSNTESAVSSNIKIVMGAVADERKNELNIGTSQTAKVTHEEEKESIINVLPHVAYLENGKVVKRAKSTKRQDATQVQDGRESRD